MVPACRRRTREQDGPVKAVTVSDTPGQQLCAGSLSAGLQTVKPKLQCAGGWERRLWEGPETGFDIAAFKQRGEGVFFEFLVLHL